MLPARMARVRSDPTRPVADAGDAADQSVAGNRRLAPDDSVSGAGVENQAMGEGAARIGDNPPGDEAGFGPGDVIQKALEDPVFGLQVPGHRLPLQQPCLVFPEPLVFVPQIGEFAEVIDGLGNGIDGPRQDVQDGGDGVRHMGADAVHEQYVDLAQDHHPDRRHQQPHKGEPLGQALDRLRKAVNEFRPLPQWTALRWAGQRRESGAKRPKKNLFPRRPNTPAGLTSP